MSLKVFFALSATGVLLSTWPTSCRAAEPLPAGIDIRMTLAGPAFVDAQGMTLYQRSGFAGTEEASLCPDRPATVRPLANVGYNQVEEFPMRVPDAHARRSCAEKYPPFLAPEGAKALGRWTLHQRQNGSLQWAYRGRPLHRSIKDSRPDDIHGWMPPDKILQSFSGWGIAAAPLGAPPNIETRLTSLGLVLANEEGKPLYYATGDKVAQSGNWKPVLAPATATAAQLSADWSVVKHRGGLHQWAWQGKPLYIYERDAGDAKATDVVPARFVDVFGDIYGAPVPGWHVAVLQAPSAPPEGVRVKSLYPDFGRTDRIYANAEGKTLYAIHCFEVTEDRLDCDDVGDSLRYWLSFCGGAERCKRDWQPFLAPQDAKSIDGLWAVARINASHPFKRLSEGETALTVWTYRGRPVFTYAQDEGPDDTHGEIDYYSTAMTAFAIYAFAAP
jgi:predicted lipoprotein with Yx(FWY)xxD motif